jgi:hypothetical protein
MQCSKCIFIGEIKYWDHLDEMESIYEVMTNSSYIRDGSISYWFHDFYNDCCLGNGDCSAKEEDDDASFWGRGPKDSFLSVEDEGGEGVVMSVKNCSDGKLKRMVSQG